MSLDGIFRERNNTSGGNSNSSRVDLGSGSALSVPMYTHASPVHARAYMCCMYFPCVDYVSVLSL